MNQIIPIQANIAPPRTKKERLWKIVAKWKAEQDRKRAACDEVMRNIKYRSIRRVVSSVCDFYRIAPIDIISHAKPTHICHARQIAMYLARITTNHSSIVIGEQLGRTHATVLHAARKVEGMMAADEIFRAQVEALREQISRQP